MPIPISSAINKIDVTGLLYFTPYSIGTILLNFIFLIIKTKYLNSRVD